MTSASVRGAGPLRDALEGFENIGVRPISDDGGDILQGEGKFKVASLRNLDLIGPYFHNGGFATLRQVIEFYNRGGDHRSNETSGQVRPLNLTEGEKSALVSFLLTLTDERVRFQAGPFDHPQIFVVNGHNPDGSDNFVEIPATGAGGGAAVQPFLGLSPFAQ
jgi:hypothetical protein